MERPSREMTFEEEYEFLLKEKEELFAKEKVDEETPFANCVVRRALRCIRKLLDETKEYRQAEEQGLLKKFLCNVGDTLYMPWEYDSNKGVAIITVKKIFIDWEDCFYVETNLDSDSEAFLEKYNYGEFAFSDFGKTVFLTREEAEQALKQMGE